MISPLLFATDESRHHILPKLEPDEDTAGSTAVSCKEEVLDAPDYGESLWGRYYPTEIPFFKLGLLDKWLRRAYHTVTLEGPFNLKKLTEDHQSQTFRSESTIDRNGNQVIQRLLLRLEGDVFGYLDPGGFKIYAPSQEEANAAAKKFRSYVKAQPAAKPRFYIISIEDHGPVAETVTIDRPLPISDEELALHYGTDFPTWEWQWRDKMRAQPSGLSVLFGPPGCGKTSYLRALMARLIDKAVFFFVPVSEIDMLSSPRFVNFWVSQTKHYPKKFKIAILEDAEELLLPRDAGTRDRVSNLLNIADGFLGDHLKLHVIATTNITMSNLDPAVLRPGRLIGAREFKRLKRTEAQRLADAKGLVLPEQDDFSLAEIYCGARSAAVVNARSPIGF
jgi:hypothetical protein